MQNEEETLDPADWDAARAQAIAIVEDAVRHVADVRERPVWRDMPPEVRAVFTGPAPEHPTPLSDVYADLRTHMLPYAMGNIHPRFWGWYMGAGNFTGALGDFLAAIDGSNLGGGTTAAAAIDAQVVDWFKEMMGFPPDASGHLTSGGSLANLNALTVARNVKAGIDVRAEGIAAIPRPLRFYASDQVHSCHQKALETLGLGARALRLVPSDAHQRIDLDALQSAITEDRSQGMTPACIIGTAGTTNTGAIDDLETLAAIAAHEDMWFHVDGCIGAFLRIAPGHCHLVAGIERADSVALDPHKWLHAPFEAGCVLVRDAQAHFAAYEMHGDYLQLQTRGLIKGRFLADYGLELSRSLKALKIWMALKEHGTAKFGRLIDQNIAQADYLANRVRVESRLSLVAPVPLNIVCFRYDDGARDEAALKALNTEIMLDLQERGIAVPSDTTVGGRHCLRVAINNHRTRRSDLDLLLDEILAIGERLAA